MQAEFGSFDTFLWGLMDSAPRQNAWTSLSQIPARTEESDAVSKALKKRGFNFVGSTICYAFMQSVGMVNDHVVDCFRYAQLKSHRPGGARQAGDGGLQIDRAKGTYRFHYATTLEHLIYNELNNANVDPDPGLLYRLKQPGPYRFQEAGAKAFRQFAGKVRLPSPWKALKVKAHKVS